MEEIPTPPFKGARLFNSRPTPAHQHHKRRALRALREKAGASVHGYARTASLELQSQLAMIFLIAEQSNESMKTRISISACRHAIQITERGYEPGIPLEIDGEKRMITEIDIKAGR